ncbi:hypothetical protein [Streptomyces sp. NPDC058620]
MAGTYVVGAVVRSGHQDRTGLGRFFGAADVITEGNAAKKVSPGSAT